MTTKRKPIEKERGKVVWQGKRVTADDRPPAPVCPECGTPGSLVHRSPTTAYFICPHCERTWQNEWQ